LLGNSMVWRTQSARTGARRPRACHAGRSIRRWRWQRPPSGHGEITANCALSTQPCRRRLRRRWAFMSTNHKKKNKNNKGSKLSRKEYESELGRLQAELCHLQSWVKAKGLRVIIVFEGRDGAGKGGTIRAITERVSPRVFRVVALPAPTDREKTQMYMQ